MLLSEFLIIELPPNLCCLPIHAAYPFIDPDFWKWSLSDSPVDLINYDLQGMLRRNIVQAEETLFKPKKQGEKTG